MRKAGKRIGIFLFVIFLLMVLFLLISFANHLLKLEKEETKLNPPGKMVEVDGHKMHVYAEGSGKETLVFLSGAGTCCPTLDFKTLYQKLTDKYHIVVVEKFGYGYSDVVDEKRDIDTMLEQSRKALSLAGENGPFVLVPHSMSGLEAIRWAQKYPQEVKAVIGLDPAVPESYDNMTPQNKFSMNILYYAAKIGLTRWIPSICEESPAISAGGLSEENQAIYRDMFYKRTLTKTMMREQESVLENARIVKEGGKPVKIPMLFFVSNGDELGMPADQWKNCLSQYISGVKKGKIVFLDCGHYVHDYASDTIVDGTFTYLNELENSDVYY